MPKFDREAVEDMILDEIQRPSERTKQVRLGPSQMGGCFYCIAETMSQMLPDPPKIRPDRFGLAAWQGTALHHYIEHTFKLDNAQYELKAKVFDVEGYGEVWGTTDLYLPDYACTLDWKRQGKWSYDATRADGPSAQYIVQQMGYGHALRQLGHDVEKVGICSIPGFSNRVEDIRFYWFDFDPQIVDNAKHNLETIWLYVLDGSWRELPSDTDCYSCTRFGR